MKGPCYANIMQKMTTNITSQPNKYRVLIVKFMQLGPNDWPKFQNYLKDIYSKKIVQTEPQKKSNETIEIIKKKKQTKSTAQTNHTSKNKSYKAKVTAISNLSTKNH